MDGMFVYCTFTASGWNPAECGMRQQQQGKQMARSGGIKRNWRVMNGVALLAILTGLMLSSAARAQQTAATAPPAPAANAPAEASGPKLATEAASPSSSAPVFRVDTREVVLDVVVTDAKQKPVDNLNKDDFKIYEDGIYQQTHSFSKPEDHLPAPDAPPVKSAADLVHAGNIPINIIILDELNTMFEDTSYGRAAAVKYLEKQPAKLLQPTTVLAISDSGLKVVMDYTQDRDALVNAVHKHFPVYPFHLMKGSDDGDQLGHCLGYLLQVAQSVKGYQGRKSIVWIGKGFPSLDTDDVNAAKADEALNDLQLVTNALLESRVVLNVIDPTATSVQQVDYSNDETVSSADLLQAEGPNGQDLFPGDIDFPSFAPATGGLAIFARNDIDQSIATAIDDSSQYYSMSYAPTNKSDDPQKFRQIVVKVNDPSLTTWTRTGYYLAHMIQPGEIPPPPPPTELAFELTSAAQATMPYSGLQVVVNPDGGKLKIQVLPLGMEYRVTKTGSTMAEVTVMTVSFGSKGKVLDHQINEIQQRIGENLSPMNFEVDPGNDKGASRIRVVVRDAVSGHIGTVDFYPGEPTLKPGELPQAAK